MRDKKGKFIKGHKVLEEWKEISAKVNKKRMKGNKLCIGRIPWNKNKPFPQMIGNTNGFKKGGIPWNKGKPYPQISGDKHYDWKGGKIIKEGYYWILNKSHPNANSKGYIKHSRVVMEKKIGRYLNPQEVVHHINGNTLDDRPENLQLFANNKEHMKIRHPNIGFQKGHPPSNTGRTHFKKGHH